MSSEAEELATLSTDEAVEKWEGLAVMVAQSYHHRVPHHAYHDLLQTCRIALWRAFEEWDPDEGVPWRRYAGKVIRRAANDFIRVERRAGMTHVGDVKAARARKVFQGPRTLNAGMLSLLFKDYRSDQGSAAADELIDRIRAAGVSERTMEAVDLIVRHGLNQRQASIQLGVSRQAVSHMLVKVKHVFRDLLIREGRSVVVSRQRED